MAISISNINLTTNGDIDGNATATIESISWTINDLLLLTINNRTGISAEPSVPLPSTTGLTWVQVGSSVYYDADSSSRKKLSLFYSVAGGTSSGTTGLTFASQNQTNIGWIIDRATGIYTAGPIVQSNTATVSADSGAISVSLSAFADATNNVAYGVFGADPGTGTMTQGSGFSELRDINDTAIWTGSEWKIGQDTTVDANFDNVVGERVGGIAIEIKMATGVTVVKDIIGTGVIPFAR